MSPLATFSTQVLSWYSAVDTWLMWLSNSPGKHLEHLHRFIVDIRACRQTKTVETETAG